MEPMRLIMLFSSLLITIGSIAAPAEIDLSADRTGDSTQISRKKYMANEDVLEKAIDKKVNIYINDNGRILELNNPKMDTILHILKGDLKIEVLNEAKGYVLLNTTGLKIIGKNSIALPTNEIKTIELNSKAKKEIRSKRSKAHRIVRGLLLTGAIVMVPITIATLSIVLW
jgi:hypothetical protein